MANFKMEEKDQNKEDNGIVTKRGPVATKTSQSSTRVKVQWPKSCTKVFPSCRNSAQEQPATSSDQTERTEETDNVVEKQEKENDNKARENKDNKETQDKQIEKTDRDCSTECKDDKCDEELAIEARLRAQRRWRMGLLKRSKFGGIGGETDVSDLFPDYFPSPFVVEEGSETDDILTSLKESKQRHRAKLLKQNSIDKIDRELGDRETKLIAGSWLQIYS